MYYNLATHCVIQFNFCWGFSYWSSPVIVPILYRRGTFTAEGLLGWTSYVVGVSIVLSVAVTCRGTAINSHNSFHRGITLYLLPY